MAGGRSAAALKDRVRLRARGPPARMGGTQDRRALTHIGACSFDPEVMRGNIENPIGVAQVPMGVAGPVLVHGQNARGLFYVPMATSEGALIRSYERGMVALTNAGGVQTALLADENQTAPAFFFDDVAEASAFSEWAPQHLAEIRSEAAATTAARQADEAQVLPDRPPGDREPVGSRTGDAQGMNMIVKATDAVCRWIESNYPIASYFLFSGLCSEKRASGFLMTRGKGKRVTAGALLPHDVLRLYLHITADQMFRVWQSTVIGHLSGRRDRLQRARRQRTGRDLHRDRAGCRQRGEFGLCGHVFRTAPRRPVRQHHAARAFGGDGGRRHRSADAARSARDHGLRRDGQSVEARRDHCGGHAGRRDFDGCRNRVGRVRGGS